MITKQELEGHWKQIKGRIQERWGQLSEDDLQRVRGSADQLIGVIQQKTGESRVAIEQFIEQSIGTGGAAAQRMAENARGYADKASEAYREQYEQVAESMKQGYQQAETMVRRNPMESVAVALGAGVIAGVVVGLALKSR